MEIKKKGINLLKDKKNKLRNHSTKVTREQKELNKFNDMQFNNKKNNKYKAKREYINKSGKKNKKRLTSSNSTRIYSKIILSIKSR